MITTLPFVDPKGLGIKKVRWGTHISLEKGNRRDFMGNWGRRNVHSRIRWGKIGLRKQMWAEKVKIERHYRYGWNPNVVETS